MHEVILVTGGADHIGKAIVEKIAASGHIVAIHYHRSADKAQQLFEQLTAQNIHCGMFQADLASYEDVVRLHEEISSELGHVSAIVNNAGYAQMKSFFDYAPNEWQREIDIDLIAVLNLAHVFIPAMRKRKYGKFISIVGDSARTGDRKLIVSATARGGVISFIKSLAKEVGRDQVQCNVVSLGLIDQQDLAFSDNILQAVKKSYAANRLGSPTDVTSAIAFLLSEESSWILGQTISINGGQTMF